MTIKSKIGKDFILTQNFNSSVYEILKQPDGKIIAVGNFTTFNGSSANRIVRLNSDGTRDTTFTIGTGADNGIKSIALQPDGKIIVAGDFTSWNGATVGRIVRLNSDGTRDTDFTTNTGTAANNGIISIAVQSDGKILAGGDFITWNGATVNRIVRLNSDGTSDTTFVTNAGTGANSGIYSMAVQSDGKILIGGYFTTWNGTTVNRIVRLNSDGTRDTDFTTNTGTGASSDVLTIALQPDGKVLVGGYFTTWNGATVKNIVRLNSDGTHDTAFTTNTGTGPGGDVYSIALQPDGKILLGGYFTTWNGVVVNGIVRLNSNGTHDTTFTANTGLAANNGINGGVYSIFIDSNEKIFIGGSFATWNSNSRDNFVVLKSNGSLYINAWNDCIPYVKISGSWKIPKAVYNKVSGEWKSSFLQGGVDDYSFSKYQNGFNVNPSKIKIQSDGKFIITGNFSEIYGKQVNKIIRLNTDKTLDDTFMTNIGSGPSDTISTVFIQSDGKIIVVGNFLTWNGVTVNRIVRLNSDGTLDTAFTTNINNGANLTINNVKTQSDGKIIVVGRFTSWNGTTVGRIVRLNSDGTHDTTFTTNTGTGAGSSYTAALIVQLDGKIIVGGDFTSWNGATVGRIVRLNSDGTLDSAFMTQIGSGSTVLNSYFVEESIALQADGKIILSGGYYFTTWNGTAVNRIVRLNSDGTRDTVFSTNIGSGPLNIALPVTLQADGKILLGGMSSWNGTTVGRIVRLNSDGTHDTAFTTNIGIGLDNSISSTVLDSSGNIIMVGSFRSFNTKAATFILKINNSGIKTEEFLNTTGNFFNISLFKIQQDSKILALTTTRSYYGTFTLNNIFRLNTDGTLDESFTNNIGIASNNQYTYAMDIQQDGKILVGGQFTTWNGATVGRIVRLNSDGTRDTTFTTNTGTGASGQINSIIIQQDGKILVGGQFTTWNGTAVGCIVRLNSDGTHDTAFTTNIGDGPDNFINSLEIQQDGKILIGGHFTSWNGATVGRIVRLNSDGTLDTAFTTNTGTGSNDVIFNVKTTFSNKILVSGYFTSWNGTTVGRIVRLNSDGTRDTNFSINVGTGPGSNYQLCYITQSDGKIIIGGFWNTWNGTIRNGIIRLNLDGTEDVPFTNNIRYGTSAYYLTNSNTIYSYTTGQISALIFDKNGKVIAGGSFPSFDNKTKYGITRIGGEIAV